jgi:hypothetical protein
MSYFQPLKSGTATLVALTITGSALVPFVTTTPAFAQRGFPQTEQLNIVIPAGTSIPVRYDKADKIVVMPDETMPLTLTVARDITDSNGRILVFAGSQINGDLRPTSGGTQFVAREMTLYRRRLDKQTRPFSINGTSDVVTRTEEIKKGANTGSLLQGAAVGGAAAAAIAALTGDHAIATEEILGGVGLGALGGLFLNRKTVNALVVYPNQDLTVRLRSEFSLR